MRISLRLGVTLCVSADYEIGIKENIEK
jgi:hypothetical protein